MNNSEYQKIFDLLKSMNKLDIITKQMINRSFDEVKNILLLPELTDKKYQKLLTSTI